MGSVLQVRDWILVLLLLLTLGNVSRSGADGGGLCPESSGAAVAMRDTLQGYCLLYPAEFELSATSEQERLFAAGSRLSGPATRLSIERTDAAGRALEELAAARTASVRDGPSPVQVMPLWLGGEPALLLAGGGGREAERIVLTIHDGWLYRFRFTPDDPARGEDYLRMERLYRTVIESFRFLPAPSERHGGAGRERFSLRGASSG